MNEVLTVVAALLFPVVALAMVLWLSHLEDTLPGAVEAARREPAPEPILAIPTHRPKPVPVPAPVVPVQRIGTATAAAPTPVAMVKRDEDPGPDALPAIAV